MFLFDINIINFVDSLFELELAFLWDGDSTSLEVFLINMNMLCLSFLLRKNVSLVDGVKRTLLLMM